MDVMIRLPIYTFDASPDKKKQARSFRCQRTCSEETQCYRTLLIRYDEELGASSPFDEEQGRVLGRSLADGLIEISNRVDRSMIHLHDHVALLQASLRSRRVV